MRYLATGTAKQISKIGLGTWQFGSKEWGYGQPYAEQGANAIVRRALDLGVTLFDTAEIYGYGRSERILGQALGDDLTSVFVATKIFPVLPLAPVVEQRAVASANRLGARHLDLYQVHQAEPGGPGHPCHARDAGPAAGRPGRRGGSQQLFAGPLAGRRGRAGRAGAQQPGQLQPRWTALPNVTCCPTPRPRTA